MLSPHCCIPCLQKRVSLVARHRWSVSISGRQLVQTPVVYFNVKIWEVQVASGCGLWCFCNSISTSARSMFRMSPCPIGRADGTMAEKTSIYSFLIILHCHCIAFESKTGSILWNLNCTIGPITDTDTFTAQVSQETWISAWQRHDGHWKQFYFSALP